MRTILNISLPKDKAYAVKKRAQRRGFSSTSGYIRFLLDLDKDLISPIELLAMAKKADREYRAGKLKKYKSLQDLL